MNVGAMGGTQNMYQYGKQGGTQGGQNAQMKDLMQSLSQEDRQALKDQLQGMSQTDRKSMVDQISQLDYTEMSSDELLSSIDSILNPSSTTDNQNSSSLLDFYA